MTICQTKIEQIPEVEQSESYVRRWFRTIRAVYSLTQQELADHLGVSRSLVGMYETERSPVPTEIEQKLLNDFPKATTHRDLALPQFPVSFPSVSMRYAGEVPMSSEWGDPLSSDIPIEMEAKFDKANRFVCRVIGDSCWPALRQGDLTVWEVDKNPTYGLICLAQRKEDSACTVKQLVYDPIAGRPTLCPVNERYDAPPDGEGWDVIARLVGVIRRVDGLETSWYLPQGLRPKHLIDNV